MKTSELLAGAVAISGGYSRPNIYDMTITPPAGVESSQIDLRRLSLNCSASGIPGRSMATVEHSQGGEIVRKIPHSVIMSDLNTTFYLSADLFEKRLLDAWQDMMYDPATGTLGWYDDYIADISLTKKLPGSKERLMGTYTFHEAYPMAITEVVQSYDAEDQISLLQVAWAYREWSFSN